MCKKLLSGLLGGGETPMRPAIAPDATRASDPVVVGSDVVSSATGGQEGSGRIRLGTKKRAASGAVAGLSL